MSGLLYPSPEPSSPARSSHLNVTTLSDAALGDSVQSREPHLSGREGDAVTLTCSYDTSSTGYVYLYWYRQFPGQAPQYILYRGAKSASELSDTAGFAQERFSSQANDSSTVLNITALELADTAVYLCALDHCAWETRALTFGKGTRLSVEPENPGTSSPSVFVVKSAKTSDGQKLTAACLAKDFYPKDIEVSMSQERDVVYKSKEGILSSNGKYSMIQVVKVEPNEEVECFVKHGEQYINQRELQSAPIPAPINNTQVCESSNSTFEEPNMEKVNMLSVTVLGLRVLLAKSIAFNMLMTVKLFIF
ncbi:T cell receptor alpha chain MC.7.G5-like [Emys orbicularis]|uniref:T cell receptor alpha chain MC.7.G5-like n=1 Tax=Emys orbicularis TaxID=82168 RepID=UPI0031FD6F1A